MKRRNNVKIDDLLEWNDIGINDPLAIDQKLILHPGEQETVEPGAKTGENEAIYYTVKSGDTFYSISRQFDVSVDDLKELNAKSGNLLKPGERLRIR
ncbi:MAG: LysM peptidoglycan-binding domain-containing protein [Cyclobacteriaceae bacterium]